MAGRRVIYPRKIRPFPAPVLFIEPEWDYVPRGRDRWEILSHRWYIAVSTTGWFRDATVDTVAGKIELADELVLVAGKHGHLTVIGHSLMIQMQLADLSELFPQRGYRAVYSYRTDERFLATVSDGKNEIDFYDLQNWCPGNISDIAAWLGRESKDHQRFSPSTERVQYDSYENLFIVGDAWDRFREWVCESCFEGFCKTISSYAFHVFSHSESAHSVVRSKDKEVIQNERRAFYGGFCVAHKLGDFNTHPYHLLDANGLYSAVERDCSLPVRFVSAKKRPQPRHLDRVDTLGAGIVHGVFQLEDGFLPVWVSGKLHWTHDRLDCWLAWPEFKWVSEHGKILELKEVQAYTVAPIFRATVTPWINAAENAKKDGKKYEKRLYKMLCNSLYGKLGQRLGSCTIFPMDESDEDGIEFFVSSATGAQTRVEKWCGSKMVTHDDDLGDTHFPSIPAMVTSYARVQLFGWCSRLGWDHVLYNDTDSIIVDHEAYPIIQPELDTYATGRLREEDSGRHLWIGAPKHYSLGNHLVLGSIPRVHKMLGTGIVEYNTREANIFGRTRETSRLTYRTEYHALNTDCIPSPTHI
jgi:hypothetical protein